MIKGVKLIVDKSLLEKGTVTLKLEGDVLVMYKGKQALATTRMLDLFAHVSVQNIEIPLVQERRWEDTVECSQLEIRSATEVRAHSLNLTRLVVLPECSDKDRFNRLNAAVTKILGG